MDAMQVTTIAGTEDHAFVDGPALRTKLKKLHGVAVASNGAIFFADTENHRIRVLEHGIVVTVAGNGIKGFADGPALQAQLDRPCGIALGHNGALYIADYGTSRIRVLYDGYLRTLAGGGSILGDGPALQCQLRTCIDVAVSPNGHIIYICEIYGHRIRELHNGQLRTIAGSGEAGFADGPALHAQLWYPQGIAVRSDGCIYIMDTSNLRLRLLKSGYLFTVAGSGKTGSADGPALQARFCVPQSICIGPQEEIYICDSANRRIRVLQHGELRTLAGNGKKGNQDGPALTASFRHPVAIALHPDGSLIVSERRRLRRISNVVPPFQQRKAASSTGKLINSSSEFTDMEISSSLASIRLHKCLVELRFPALLKTKSVLESYPIPLDTLEAFRVYLYSEDLPKEAPAKVYLGLAFIFQKCDCSSAALECLKILCSETAVSNVDTIESLISLYGYSLDLSPFDDGINVAKYLLLKHRRLITEEMVLANHSHDFLKLLIRILLPVTPFQDPLVGIEPKKDSSKSLQAALTQLFESKRGADFEIVITPTDGSQERSYIVKCHRFVLHARWPFFRAVLNSNMRETNDRRYTIKAATTEGDIDGMHPTVLNALFEVCYTGMISERTRKQINLDMAIHFHAAQMYFRTASMYQPVAGALNGEVTVGVDEPFVELADHVYDVLHSSIVVFNCIVLFDRVLKMTVPDIASGIEALLLVQVLVILLLLLAKR